MATAGAHGQGRASKYAVGTVNAVVVNTEFPGEYSPPTRQFINPNHCPCHSQSMPSDGQRGVGSTVCGTMSGACVSANPGGAAACPGMPALPLSCVWRVYGRDHDAELVGSATPAAVAIHHSCDDTGASTAGSRVVALPGRALAGLTSAGDGM